MRRPEVHRRKPFPLLVPLLVFVLRGQVGHREVDAHRVDVHHGMPRPLRLLFQDFRFLIPFRDFIL